MKRILVFMVLLFLSCSKETPVEVQNNKLVIEAFIFADQPVKDVFVGKAIPFKTGKRSEMEPVPDAIVELQNNDVVYQLVPTINGAGEYDGHYHYPRDDLTFTTGDCPQLIVRYKEQTLKATTVVPPTIENIAIPVDTVIADVEKWRGAHDPLFLVKWDSCKNSENGYYYVVQVADSNATAINPLATLSKVNSNMTYETFFKFWPGGMMQFYGRYKITVYNTMPELGYYSNFGIEDSRNLAGNSDNIENGLGIFAAFNGDSTFFNVVPKEGD